MNTLKYDHVMTNMSASPFTSASGYQFKSAREEKQYHTATKRFMKKWYGKKYISNVQETARDIGRDAGYKEGYQCGLEEGKAAAMKEAAEKYNMHHKNTLLKAVEVQAAAMECLTRTVAAISESLYTDMNPNLSKFLDYLRSNHDPDWNYTVSSPLDKLSVVFPDKFRWNESWGTFDLIEPLGPGVSPSDYVARFFGMSTSKYLDIFAFMDEGTSQEQFIAALETYAKETD